MKTIVLKRKQQDGSMLYAEFCPDKGMNLVSLKKGSVELIDQSTAPLFDERFAGLGALIGPHFYHLPENLLPHSCPESLFPHIGALISKGQKDLFSHGIGRYVPWKYQFDDSRIIAKLASVDSYEGYPLSELEGCNFFMSYEAEILDDRFRIKIHSKSDTRSVIGLHYYFNLKRPGFVSGSFETYYYDKGQKKDIPNIWKAGTQKILLNLDNSFDQGFIPLEYMGINEVLLTTSEFRLKMQITQLEGSELSVQVYHPENSSYVCVEPISAENPRGPLPKEGNLMIDFFIDLPNQND